jgi:ubiquinone/menaquinone biosynthesis C-methylase UbiE
MPDTLRRQHLRRTFDERVDREWHRYSGEPRRLLVRTLRERFLQRHLGGARGVTLELGPGPGRFTPALLRATRGRVLAVDLSRGVLVRARNRARRKGRAGTTSWIQGAGEHLPLADGSVDAVVALGNIVCFAARDGPRLLRELHRVVRPDGILVADFASPGASTVEFLDMMSGRRELRRILRRPSFYLIDEVLTTGFQPYLPARLAAWEFRFYTPDEASQQLVRSGFRVTDLMAVGPIGWEHGRIAASARRESRTWENLLRLEERLGRRAGFLETGHGFLVAAARVPRTSTGGSARSTARGPSVSGGRSR